MIKLKFNNQMMLFLSFWLLFVIQIPYGYILSYHTKSQNEATDGSPDILNRASFQIPSIFYKYLSTPLTKGEKKRNFLLGLGSFHAENIDITLTETAKTSFVAIILIVNLIVYQSLTNCLSIYFITL